MAKGTTTERGYGWQHQKLRERWKPQVNALQVSCARCGQLIVPNPALKGDGWDLGHNEDRSGYQGPEHSSCNQVAGARNAAAVTNGRRAMTIREW